MKISNTPVILQIVRSSNTYMIVYGTSWRGGSAPLSDFSGAKNFFDICQGYSGKNGKTNGKSGYELYAEFSHLFMKQPGQVVLPKARLWEGNLDMLDVLGQTCVQQVL